MSDHPHNSSNFANMAAQGFAFPFTINDHILNYYNNNNPFMYDHQQQLAPLQNPSEVFRFTNSFQGCHHVDHQLNTTLPSVFVPSSSISEQVPINHLIDNNIINNNITDDSNHEVIRDLETAAEINPPTPNSISSSEDDFSKNSKHSHKGQLGDGTNSEQLSRVKKKGKEKKREARIAFMTKSEVDNLEDGYRWRKYGQKPVKNSPFQRSYYRCTTQKCIVKKRIERSSEDPSVVITTYEGQHNHHNPATFRGSSTALFGPSLLMPTPSIFPNNFPRQLLFPSITHQNHSNSTLYQHVLVSTGQQQQQPQQQYQDQFHCFDEP